MNKIRRYEYLLALGSNQGDRELAMARACDLIELKCGQVTSKSPLYATEPVGAADEEFLNGALICASDLHPEEILDRLLEIEASLGRVRKLRWGNRTIDLDILLCRTAADRQLIISDSANLTVPHPEMLDRNFVLVPAVDIAPDWIHPVSGRSLAAEMSIRSFKLPKLNFGCCNLPMEHRI